MARFQLSLVALLALLLLSGVKASQRGDRRQEEPKQVICPSVATEPYEIEKAAPFSWCRAGDIGRVPLPFTMRLPSWSDILNCDLDSSECTLITQLEMFTPETLTFAAVTFNNNASAIVITPVSLPEVGPPSVLLFPQGNISLFHLVSGPDHKLSGILVEMQDGEWYFGSVLVDFDNGFKLNNIYRVNNPLAGSTARIVQGRSYVDLSTGMWTSVLLLKEQVVPGQTPLAHLVFGLFDLSKPFQTVDYVLNITNFDAKSEFTLDLFVQHDWERNMNRTLFSINDELRVHVIQAPIIINMVPESRRETTIESTHSDFAANGGLLDLVLDWKNDTALTLMFKVKDMLKNRIIKVNFFSEATSVPSSAVPFVWMNAIIAPFFDMEPYSISTTLYYEFGYKWYEDATRSILSPLGENFAKTIQICGNATDVFIPHNTGVCTPRVTLDLLNRLDMANPTDIHVRQIRPADWLSQLLPGFPAAANVTSSPVSLIFIAERAYIHVIGLIPSENRTTSGATESAWATLFEEMNQFPVLGGLKRLEVSENGLHVIGIVEKYMWEINSINRFADICEQVKIMSTLPELEQKVLEPWLVPCSSSYRRPIASDFVQYVGMCPLGSFCYSARENVLGGVPPGMYANFPLQMGNCPEGSYCFGGVRRDCPPGFICPRMLSLMPTLCPLEAIMTGKTCFQDGLVAPIPAPPGTIPQYPQAPAFPAPPGWYAEHGSNGEIAPTMCAPGEYCPLGRDQFQNRLCPAGTYCPQTSSIYPVQCRYNVTDNYSSYCPEGSVADNPCPAGYFCQGPDKRAICQERYFCPAGTMSATLCPAGFYCPDPSTKVICPSRYYCELGTVTPTPCAVLSICPPGTKNNSANFILALVFVIVTGILIAVWKIVDYKTTKARADRSRQMQEAEKQLNRSKLANLRNGASDPPRNQRSTMDDDNDVDDDEDNLDEEASGRRSLLRGSSASGQNSAGGIPNAFNSERDALVALIDSDLNTRMPELPFKVDVTFKELGLKIKGTEKKVLDGVTGTIRHGRVTAVMGPSGAGKTTFMSTLANKAHYGDRIGTILLNGEAGDLTAMRNLVGFVPQEDVMLRELSVTEILTFNAKMRLPVSMSDEEKMSHVRRTIRLLGLFDIRHELIGDETKRGISGGQRKRVNIGMELVSQPTVLFLDEPTSGLDATSSLEVCGILRRVAEEAGMTVISVIHQPRYDIFTMFHDVLLLGKGGRTVYLGPTKDAVEYFAKLGFEVPPMCNPADFLIDVVSGSVPRQGHPEYVKEDLFDLWVEHAKRREEESLDEAYKSDVGAESDAELVEDAVTRKQWSGAPKPIKLIAPETRGGKVKDFVLPDEAQRRTSNFLFQLWWFFVRSLVQQKRNWISILTDFILAVVSAITFGVVFIDSHYIGPPGKKVCDLLPVPGLIERCSLPIDDPFPQIALMTTIGLALPAAMAALRVFGPERVVFWRESSVGANTAAYYLGKELGFLPSSVLLPLVYAGVFYNFTVPRMSFGLLYLIFLSTWWCSTGLAMVVSILAPPNLATISTVVVVFGMSMFSGVRPTLLELKKMFPPFNLISYVSFFRWLTEAYYVAEIYQWRHLYNIESGLKMLNYSLEHFPMAIGLVVAMGFAFRFIALLCLELLHRDQRK